MLTWRRLIVPGAALVLAAAVWTAQTRPRLADAGPDASLGPAPGAPMPPHDAAGWRSLGQAKFAAGRYGDAAAAYAQAVAQVPGDAATWSALGEARVMASPHDPMPAEARQDFRKAIAIDPGEPRARYFLGIEKDLAGDHHGAIAAWLALLGDTPPGAPWEADLRRTITQVGRINHIAVAALLAAVAQPAPAASALPPVAPVPGPSAQDLQAASAIPPSQQQAMAQAMVARLEQRLAADPHNPDGWTMLIRSRMTLDGPGAAAAALTRAVAADPADAARLREQAAGIGIK